MINQNEFTLKPEKSQMVKSPINPFLRYYETKAKFQHHQVLDSSFVISTGESSSPVATITNTYRVDSAKFCKVYLAAIEPLISLNSSGRRVFHVLFTQVRKSIGSDKVQLAFLHAQDLDKSMSLPTYTRGIRALYDAKFIAPITGLISTWWINPDFIFNGSRLHINQSFVLKDSVDVVGQSDWVDQSTGEVLSPVDPKKVA